MAERGWKQLLANHTWFRGKGKYPISAYSEFMPPPRLGRKPYGSVDHLAVRRRRSVGLARHRIRRGVRAAPGLGAHRPRVGDGACIIWAAASRRTAFRNHKLHDNPYWPEHTQAPPAERYVVLAPLALSRTQDDKGRVRWTLFGASEQGPAKAFWRGFYTEPGVEWPVERSLDFVRRLLAAAYGETPENLADLKRAGFRVLADDSEPLLPHWKVKIAAEMDGAAVVASRGRNSAE